MRDRLVNPNSAGFVSGGMFINLSVVASVVYDDHDEYTEADDDLFEVNFTIEWTTKSSDTEFSLRKNDYDRLIKALETYWSGA